MGKIKLVGKSKTIQTTFNLKAYQFIRELIDVVISIYLIIIIAVLPLYLESGNETFASYEIIGSYKYMFLKKISTYTGCILIPLLILCFITYMIDFVISKKSIIRIKHIKIKNILSITDICAICFGLIVIISYFFTAYREEALWGADRWYLGVATQLTFVSVYFLVSRMWVKKKWIVALFLPVSGLVFLLGLLNRFGIYPINMERSPLFISTIGNINWYCGYMVTVLFGGVYLFWNRDLLHKWQKILLGVYIVIGFASLVTQGSSSGILTLICVMYLLFVISSLSNGKRMQSYFEIAILLAIACILIGVIRILFPEAITYREGSTELFTLSPLPILMAVIAGAFWIWINKCNQKDSYSPKIFRILSIVISIVTAIFIIVFIVLLTMNTMNPGSIGILSDKPYFTFSPSWGSYRGATWTASIKCFMEQGIGKKLVGVGPDCMAAYIENDAGKALLNLVRGNFGTSRLTNAHNEWLTMLVNVGLLGMISYAAMLVSAIIRYLKRGKASIITGICGICIFAYCINNMVSFQQSLNGITMFVVLGIGEAYARE